MAAQEKDCGARGAIRLKRSQYRKCEYRCLGDDGLALATKQAIGKMDAAIYAQSIIECTLCSVVCCFANPSRLAPGLSLQHGAPNRTRTVQSYRERDLPE